MKNPHGEEAEVRSCCLLFQRLRVLDTIVKQLAGRMFMLCASLLKVQVQNSTAVHLYIPRALQQSVSASGPHANICKDVSRVARLLRKPLGRCRFLHHVVGLVQVSRRDVFFWGKMSNFRHIPFALPRRFSKLVVALTSTFCAQDCFLLEGTLNPATVIRVEHSED